MIRHIYGLSYDNEEKQSKDSTVPYSVNGDLLFHISVFIAADKYDVALLRPHVVKRFRDLMQTNWKGDQFISSIQMLCGQSAGHLADRSLQAAVASFCTAHLNELLEQDKFRAVIWKEEPFASRLLTNLVDRTSTFTLYACGRCKDASDEMLTKNTRYACFSCGRRYNCYDYLDSLTAVKKAHPL